MWVNASTCVLIFSITLGVEWPTFNTAMPAARSKIEFPSTSNLALAITDSGLGYTAEQQYGGGEVSTGTITLSATQFGLKGTGAVHTLLRSELFSFLKVPKVLKCCGTAAKTECFFRRFDAAAALSVPGREPGPAFRRVGDSGDSGGSGGSTKMVQWTTSCNGVSRHWQVVLRFRLS